MATSHSNRIWCRITFVPQHIRELCCQMLSISMTRWVDFAGTFLGKIEVVFKISWIPFVFVSHSRVPYLHLQCTYTWKWQWFNKIKFPTGCNGSLYEAGKLCWNIDAGFSPFMRKAVTFINLLLFCTPSPLGNWVYSDRKKERKKNISLSNFYFLLRVGPCWLGRQHFWQGCRPGRVIPSPTNLKVSYVHVFVKDSGTEKQSFWLNLLLYTCWRGW